MRSDRRAKIEQQGSGRIEQRRPSKVASRTAHGERRRVVSNEVSSQSVAAVKREAIPTRRARAEVAISIVAVIVAAIEEIVLADLDAAREAKRSEGAHCWRVRWRLRSVLPPRLETLEVGPLQLLLVLHMTGGAAKKAQRQRLERADPPAGPAARAPRLRDREQIGLGDLEDLLGVALRDARAVDESDDKGP
jgi:hypothetical protein